ncbi:hypothetical protein SISNIDRAFT_33345 [Sistotremastrum niveocremeum HHB9708]|nr:hypothetical protein SISNIDRAFT_33345 [Sistotremastrum niveocremeum HHB9708]
MPTGPLTLADIGSLNKDKGCDVCGEKAFKNCASCGIALYCGKPCQEQAWPSHKRQCKALSSGVWTTVKFQPLLDAMPFMAGMHSVNLNRYTRTDEVKSGSGGRTKETRNPPPNDHGTKPFIIKIQTTQASIRVYDRRRTLDLYLMSKNDPVNFRRLHEAAGTGFKGMKCYRWAKRVSDWELSICLDIKLPEDPKW